MTEPEATEILELDKVSITYPGGHRAVRNVSFSLRAADRVGLVGESGSGKTSLARAIMGLVPVSAGAIRIGGRAVESGDAAARRLRARMVQMVFQDPYHSLNPRRTIRQALFEALAARGPGEPSVNRVSEAVRLLEKVRLESDALDRFPHEFSGGQRQRICIARALAPEPRLLVCDEAVSALDTTTQLAVVRLLLDLSRAGGIALLFITHDLPLVEFLCERALILDRGSLVEDGPVATVFTRPAAPKTKELVESVLRLPPATDD
ncbi:MAG: ABC transporter ATP-binding protein [Puniceicoccaceae bacterium]